MNEEPHEEVPDRAAVGVDVEGKKLPGRGIVPGRRQGRRRRSGLPMDDLTAAADGLALVGIDDVAPGSAGVAVVAGIAVEPIVARTADQPVVGDPGHRPSRARHGEPRSPPHAQDR